MLKRSQSGGDKEREIYIYIERDLLESDLEL